ncbi:MAG: bifunctional precorrin-2 dehydrogenase/sirohydrochlorin ferrochelatase [Thaumarchaeota archaeon]|nr:bifunctional precorrin-2 dehydrogenase/sirohydrochlorin ferrochelatase [Nitrososphaerota archaeon]
MLIDILLSGKNVAIFGGGKEATFKVQKILDDIPSVTVVSRAFSSEILDISRKESGVSLVEFDLNSDLARLVNLIPRPDIAIIATDDTKLNRKLNDFTRGLGAMVCVVDTPELCDFAMPAIAKFGESVRVGISTRGNSPAMASVIRKKIEATITEMDLLQIRLQEHVRKIGKDHIANFEDRKKALYDVIENKEVNSLLEKNQYDDAKRIAEAIILSRK